MLKALAILATALLMVGCANTKLKEANQRMEAMKEQAEAGQVKWSVYYETAFREMSALPDMRGKGFMLKKLNESIDAARSYEAGKISKEEFDSFRRRIKAEVEEQNEKIAEEIRSRQVTQPPVIFQPPPRPVNCTSTVSGRTVDTVCR